MEFREDLVQDPKYLSLLAMVYMEQTAVSKRSFKLNSPMVEL
jgi:hypothetical protein